MRDAPHLHSWPTAAASVRQPPQTMSASEDSYKLLWALHDPASGARAAFNLPSTCYAVDYGAAACKVLGWHVVGGKAMQSVAGNLQLQLLLCQQELATSKQQLTASQQQLSSALSLSQQLQAVAVSSAAQMRAAQQSAADAEATRVRLERQAERSAKALAEAQQLLRDGPRRSVRAEAAATPEAAAAHGEQCACCSAFQPRPRSAPRGDGAPCSDGERCGGCDMDCDSEPPTPTAPPASPPAEVVELRLQLEAASVRATGAEELATHAAQQLKAARATLAARERSHDYIDCEALYEQFMAKASGEERASSEAAERAAQRAVQQAADALPADDGQAGVVLDAVLKRRRLAAAEAGIRTAGECSFNDAAMARAREACVKTMQKKGALSAEEATALDTLLTFLAPEADDEARQRGKHAKRARVAGAEVEGAAVTQVRAWAEALGMSRTTTWRHLKVAVEKRKKLDESEGRGYWLATKLRAARRIPDEVVELVHKFYIDHPSIKRSPIATDVLWLKTGPNKEDRVKVAKLLSE
eukprot:2791174-Prymnesium_polylepis.1